MMRLVMKKFGSTPKKINSLSFQKTVIFPIKSSIVLPLQESFISALGMKMKDFFAKMSKVWPEVLTLSEQYKLVSVYEDRIEALG